MKGNPGTPGGYSAGIYRDVRAAILARDMEQAHNLLRKLIHEKSDDPDYLLLMAWTAPTQRTASLIFKQFKLKHPDHPKARGELFWSGKAWAKASSDAAVDISAPPVAPVTIPAAPRVVPKPVKQVPVIKKKTKRVSPLVLLQQVAQVGFYRNLALFMIGVTLAELVTTYMSPVAGLALHGGLLVLILVQTALAATSEQNFFLALALAPLIRLVSLSMPLLEFEFKYWYMVIGLPLLVASFMVLRLSGYRRAHVGLAWGRHAWMQVMVAIAGVGLGFMEYLILKPEPLTDTFNLQSVWLPALILLVFTGFLEELIFRGLMQRAAAEQLRKFGPLYISLLFAVLHIGYKSILDLAFVFLVGFLFSLVAQQTRSLLGVTISHGLTNISLFLIFPFVMTAPIAMEQLPSVLLPGDNVVPPAKVEISGPAMWVSPPTPTPRPTLIPTPTATETLLPTLTSTPTATLVNSPTPMLIVPIYYTATPTTEPSSTVKATNTPLPTATSTLTPTATPTVPVGLGTSEPIPPTATETPALVP